MSDFWQSLTEGATLTNNAHEALQAADFAKAKSLLEQSRAMALADYGEDNPVTAMRSLFLSQALHGLGDYRGARELAASAFKAYDPDVFDLHVANSFERTLIEICTMQGHFFIVEDLQKMRIDRLMAMGHKSDHDRAVEQDRLAYLYLRQDKYDEALELLNDSVVLLERIVGELHRDTAVCYQYLTRVHRHRREYARAVPYAEKYLANAAANFSEESIETAVASDTLAYLQCRLAEHTGDAALGSEGLARARRAWETLNRLDPNGRHTKNTAENLGLLMKHLSRLSGIVLPEPVKQQDCVSLPRHCFISHSYRDVEAVKKLLQSLPTHVVPIVFEPINVSPAEYVSTKLVNAVSSCDAVIVIDAEASNASFWTAFERNLAVRLDKKIFKYDTSTGAIEPYALEFVLAWLAICAHPADEAAVTPLMQWLAADQGFAVVHDPKALKTPLPNFAHYDPALRNNQLEVFLRSARGVYMIFLSERTFADPDLRAHAEEVARSHPATTIFCWLGKRSGHESPALLALPPNHCFEFDATGGLNASMANRYDDLMVRLYWIFHTEKLGLTEADRQRGGSS